MGWRVSSTGVPRTGLTPLTDDELVVCDAVCSRWTAEGCLLDPNQAEALGLPYRHGVAPERMSTFLDGLTARGIAAVDDSNGMRFVTLTGFGGSLWEQERQPVWDAYCTDRSRLVDGLPSLRVLSVQAEVAEVFFRTGTDAGLWTPTGQVQISQQRRVLITPWKSGDVTVLTCSLVRLSSRPDWRLYESRRTWWRTVFELLRSHRVIQESDTWSEWPPSLFK